MDAGTVMFTSILFVSSYPVSVYMYIGGVLTVFISPCPVSVFVAIGWRSQTFPIYDPDDMTLGDGGGSQA